MSAGVLSAPARPALKPLRRIPFRPAEGWLTLLATAVMVMVLGGSLQDAAWTTDAAQPQTHFLPWIALVGVAFGVFGAKVGWGRWRTHFVGALFGGLALPLIVGGIALGPDANVGWDPASLANRLLAMLQVVQGVWRDLVIAGRPYTTQEAHYHLVFGVMVWGAGMLAGFSVFGHRRPLDAVVVVGLVIAANMAMTQHEQLSLIVIFSAAALLLLIRTHVFDEELVWARRKIGDPTTVGQLYLRGGAAFVTVAIIGSVLLTWSAASAPLQGLWADLPRNLQDLAQILQRIGPAGGDPKGLGLVGFGRNADTGGLWQPSNNIAFRVRLSPIEGDRQFKWRAGAYAEYTRYGWRWGQPETSDPVAARDSQPDPSGEPSKFVGRRELRVTIFPDAFRELTVISPNQLLSVDRATKSIGVGNGKYFTSMESTEGVAPYSIVAWVPVYEDIQGGITEARLRQAGKNYPPELKAIYTALPPDSMGPFATELLNRIKGDVPRLPDVDPTNPYDLARTMEQYLSTSPAFTYDPDVRDERNAQCGVASSAECFAIIRRGYCEYYATAMAVMLRAAEIPARVAYGFLPGERDSTNQETVTAASAHWWVEVYFPGTGWVEFDPTAQVGQPQPIPSGSVGPPTARPASLPPATAPPEPSEPTNPQNTPRGGGPTGSGPFIAVTVILVIGVLALAFAAIRRTPNKPMHPDKAWGSMARLAARLGLGPRPSQTVYEYAGALGDEVPAVRVELTTLARAKVEVAYGRRDLGQDRMRRIAEAYHRLRLALLGLLFRRGLRRGKRR